MRPLPGACGPRSRNRLARLKAILVLTLALALLVSPAGQAPAQDLASLVADAVSVSGNDTLVADGNVEVFYEGRTLRAKRILYDKSTDRLTIDGPIVLKDGTGTVILARQADLAADLSDGVLQSARVVLNQQLQLTSAEIMRIGGRYTALGQSVVSSCKVCKTGQTPLWEIRAQRIVHDEQERQIYFDHARLRFFGVPVAYLPRLRIPDPSLDRARGVLRPQIRSSSVLGFGLAVPYFIPLGPSRDVTLIPYLATKNAQSLGLRYRQAFRAGQVEFNGAVSHDSTGEDVPRFYGVLNGSFALPRGFGMSFSGTVVSDRNYLRDYGISTADRLDSQIAVTRTRRDEYIDGRIINFRTIRAGAPNSTVPSLITDVTLERRFSPESVGGTGSVSLQSQSAYRSSDIAADLNGDGVGDGRDLARLSFGADWRRNLVLPAGVMMAALTEFRADGYEIRQDTVYGGSKSRLLAGGAVEFRWPLVRSGPTGASHIIEPVVQLMWSGARQGLIPNEDSRLVEFDESSLFSFSRYPGRDAVETGARANVGLGYTRYDPAGWSLGVLVGRVYRAKADDQFGVASGLSGATSDWLAATELSLASGFSMTNRLVFDDGFSLTKAELRLALTRARFGINSSYVMVLADPLENRATRASELTLNGGYQVTDFWRGDVISRYDFQSQRLQSTGLKVGFKNECLNVDVGLARNFTSSTQVRASTDFTLSIDLLGFGGKALSGPSRTCRG